MANIEIIFNLIQYQRNSEKLRKKYSELLFSQNNSKLWFEYFEKQADYELYEMEFTYKYIPRWFINNEIKRIKSGKYSGELLVDFFRSYWKVTKALSEEEKKDITVCSINYAMKEGLELGWVMDDFIDIKGWFTPKIQNEIDDYISKSEDPIPY